MKSSPALVMVAALAGCSAAPREPTPTTKTPPPATADAATRAPGTISIHGVVRSAGAAPVAHAVVALVRHDANTATAVASANTRGGFAFDVAPGKYALTATAPEHTAVYHPVRAWTADGEVRLSLGSGGDMHRGSVVNESGAPWPHRRVRIQRASRQAGDVFYCDTDANGNFQVELPRAVGYQFSVDVPGKVPVFVNVAGKPTQPVRLAMPAIANDQVIGWLRANAVRLTTTRPGSGFADLRGLKRAIGDARVVGLGEATHGSRELRQVRRRMLEYLVSEHGFTVLAVESSYAASVAINDYVLGNKAGLRLQLAVRARFRSQPETLAAIEWMRRYNADPTHTTKLRFIGVDIQGPWLAARRLVAYLGRVDSTYAAAVRKGVARLLDRRAMRTYSRASATERKTLRSALAALVKRLKQRRSAYVRKTGKRAWLRAGHLAQTLVQAERMYAVMVGPNTAAFNARDRAMAENIKWVLNTSPRGTRVVYWAHNGHVATTHPRRKPQGAHLRTMFQKRYLSIATSFFNGSFRAVGRKNGRPTGWQSHVATAALPGTVGRTLYRTGQPILFVDMRRRPRAGPVAQWFRKPHPIRSIGAVFMGERLSYDHVVLPDTWDALIFIRKTSATKPPGPR